jgi:RNA polymerase sigma factor FliA
MDAKKILDIYILAKARSESNIEVVEYIVDIDAALSRISKRHRFILTKIHFEGYSQVEVAKMLGITKSTLNGVYSTALEAFRKEFSK